MSSFSGSCNVLYNEAISFKHGSWQKDHKLESKTCEAALAFEKAVNRTERAQKRAIPDAVYNVRVSCDYKDGVGTHYDVYNSATTDQFKCILECATKRFGNRKEQEVCLKKCGADRVWTEVFPPEKVREKSLFDWFKK